MRVGSSEFRRAVVQAASQSLTKGSEQTLVVALATVACEFPCPGDAPAVVRALMRCLPESERKCALAKLNGTGDQLTSASVQEIGMLALGAQLALIPERDRGSLVDESLRALDSLKSKSVKHIAKVSSVACVVANPSAARNFRSCSNAATWRNCGTGRSRRSWQPCKRRTPRRRSPAPPRRP